MALIIGNLWTIAPAPAAGTTNATVAAPPWSREVAIVSLASFPFENAKALQQDIRKLGELVRSCGLEPDWVDADIFLPEHRPQCDQYRRILIPIQAICFTPVMYAGMTAYVRRGGLLISNSTLYGIDQNGDRKYNGKGGDAPHPGKKRGFSTLGVYGDASAQIAALNVLLECPLSAGLPPERVLIPSRTLTTRDTLNRSAEVVIAYNGANRYGQILDRPFVSYKHDNLGACVFVAPNLQTDEPVVRQIASNCFSRTTLEWLTSQGPEDASSQ